MEVPSTDEKIEYRPFLVKEEKILLIAMESGESADIVNAVKDIVSECTFNKLELKNMPMFIINLGERIDKKIEMKHQLKKISLF